jgi:hypothetical protein
LSNNHRILFSGGRVEAVPEVDSFDVAASKAELKKGKDEQYIDLYMEVGTYLKISPMDFLNSPYVWIKGIRERLAEKLENRDESVLNYEHLALLLTMARMFGKK